MNRHMLSISMMVASAILLSGCDPYSKISQEQVWEAQEACEKQGKRPVTQNNFGVISHVECREIIKSERTADMKGAGKADKADILLAKVYFEADALWKEKPLSEQQCVDHVIRHETLRLKCERRPGELTDNDVLYSLKCTKVYKAAADAQYDFIMKHF